MTYKTLLTHVEPAWGSDRALNAAVELCRRFEAHLIGLCAQGFAPVDFVYNDGSVVEMVRQQFDADAADAEQRFRAATEPLEGRRSWARLDDLPATSMASCARGADLVVARRTGRGSTAYNLCRVPELILNVGAPVLLVPDHERPLRAERVLVAWRDGLQARRALADALPFLQQAKEVRLLEICSPDDMADRRAMIELVRQRLIRLGVRADAEIAPSRTWPASTELSRAAEAMGADLIVAGAYGHWRLQEWVLGGVTEDLVEACDSYVLFGR